MNRMQLTEKGQAHTGHLLQKVFLKGLTAGMCLLPLKSHSPYPALPASPSCLIILDCFESSPVLEPGISRVRATRTPPPPSLLFCTACQASIMLIKFRVRPSFFQLENNTVLRLLHLTYLTLRGWGSLTYHTIHLRCASHTLNEFFNKLAKLQLSSQTSVKILPVLSSPSF